MKKVFLLSAAFLLLFSLFLNTPKKAHAQNQLWQTIVGTPIPPEVIVDDGGSGGSGGGGGGGSGGMVSCPSNDYRKCLTEQFGVKIEGSPTDAIIESTYKGMKLYTPYTTMFNSFKKEIKALYFHPADTCLGTGLGCSGKAAWGYATSDGTMYLFRNVFSTSTSYKNYFMVHESAHIADNNMGRANPNLYYNAYTLGKDKDCFNSIGVIKTYPYTLLGSNPELWQKQNETFADSVANTILCKDNQQCGPNGLSGTAINDWPDKCSYINKYILNVIN